MPAIKNNPKDEVRRTLEEYRGSSSNLASTIRLHRMGMASDKILDDDLMAYHLWEAKYLESVRRFFREEK